MSLYCRHLVWVFFSVRRTTIGRHNSHMAQTWCASSPGALCNSVTSDGQTDAEVREFTLFTFYRSQCNLTFHNICPLIITSSWQDYSLLHNTYGYICTICNWLLRNISARGKNIKWKIPFYCFHTPVKYKITKKNYSSPLQQWLIKPGRNIWKV